MCDFYGALIPAHLGSAQLRSVLFSLVLFVRIHNLAFNNTGFVRHMRNYMFASFIFGYKAYK